MVWVDGADSCVGADSCGVASLDGADSCAGAASRDVSCAGADCAADDSPVPSVAALGAWAGAFSALEELVDELLDWAFFALTVPVLAEALIVFPGNALAATSVNSPVRATLPAISQRLALVSLRRAASRVRVL